MSDSPDRIADQTDSSVTPAPADPAGAAPADPADPPPEPLIASAPGVGTRVGALNFSTLRPLGWLLTATGALGTLMIAVSYVTGWLTISAESFGEVETASLGLGEAVGGPLWLMYRIATIAMIFAAIGLVLVPEAARQPLWLGGLAAAALSLLSALIATVVIGAALSRAFAAYGIDASTPGVNVGYGGGMYAGYLGIAGVAAFIGFFDHLHRRPARRFAEPRPGGADHDRYDTVSGETQR